MEFTEKDYCWIELQKMIELAKHWDEYDIRDHLVKIRESQRGKVKARFFENSVSFYFFSLVGGRYVFTVTELEDNTDYFKLEKRGIFKTKTLYEGGGVARW